MPGEHHDEGKHAPVVLQPTHILFITDAGKTRRSVQNFPPSTWHYTTPRRDEGGVGDRASEKAVCSLLLWKKTRAE